MDFIQYVHELKAVMAAYARVLLSDGIVHDATHIELILQERSVQELLQRHAHGALRVHAEHLAKECMASVRSKRKVEPCIDGIDGYPESIYRLVGGGMGQK